MSTDDQQSDTELHLGFLLSQAAEVFRTLNTTAMARFGVIPRQAGVLTLLAHDGPLRQCTIGERLRIDRTTMVAFIDHLETIGAATREPHPEDRRAYAVTLTPKGRRLARKLERVIMETETFFVEPLGRRRAQQLKTLLAALLAAHQELAAEILTSTSGEKGHV